MPREFGNIRSYLKINQLRTITRVKSRMKCNKGVITMEFIIEAKNINLEYNGKDILNIDDFKISISYDKMRIIGEDGAGKTTLLKSFDGANQTRYSRC